MWATVSTLLGGFLLYLLLIFFSLPIPVFFAIFAFYLSYASKPRPSFRHSFPGFHWLRTKHCVLSYTGRTDLLFDKEVPRLFVFHPHGVHCVGATLLASDPKTTHIRLACTYLLFWIPIVREFAYWANAFSCTAENIAKVLKDGNSVVLYPGGMNEIPGASFLRNDAAKSLYTKRKGFVDIALTVGCEIVPCWIEGEEDLYTVYHPWPQLQALCYRWFRYPWPIISWGWNRVPFLPKAKPITIHIGEPIDCSAQSIAKKRKQTAIASQFHRKYETNIKKLERQVKENKAK